MSQGADDLAGRPHETGSGERTVELAGCLGRQLKRGDIVVISGDLGAGKTTFARGICRSLGVVEPVTSPTFTIGQTYRGRDREGKALSISHLDLYRLAGLEGEDPALVEDYLGPERIAIVEWPEIALEPLVDRLTWRVAIEHAGGDRRRITISNR